MLRQGLLYVLEIELHIQTNRRVDYTAFKYKYTHM